MPRLSPGFPFPSLLCGSQRLRLPVHPLMADKEELKKITDKDIQINIFEVKRPELDAVIVANNIARQAEGKIAYRRAIKMAIANTMRMGAEGIKVLISGRLNRCV